MSGRINVGVYRPVIRFGVLGAVFVLILGVVAVLHQTRREKPVPMQWSAPPTISADALARVSRTRVFFGHQSVGANLLTGVPRVYAAQGVQPPPVEEGKTDRGSDGGFLTHEFIGVNEQPLTKIEEFDKAMRGGMADHVDVALMKLCYVDINTGTDVDALFERYRDTMAGLERDFPDVTFIHATAPVTTEQGLLARLKATIKRSNRFSAAENVVREHFNALIRAEYAGHHLLDLAAVESTRPDGTRTAGQFDGRQYLALYDGYAADLGHLNQFGSEVAATAFLQAVAEASQK